MTSAPGSVIYPIDEWRIIEEGFDYITNSRDETIFMIGNGLVGVRGGFEEGYAGPLGTSHDGTYINGFYDSTPISHPEVAFGLAHMRQTILNVTNGKIIRLYVDGEAFQMTTENVVEYRRELDLRSGVLSRRVVWRTKTGKEVLIEVERLTSFQRRRVLAISYRVTPLNFDGTIQIVSALDGAVTNRIAANDPRVGAFFDGQVLLLDEKIQKENYSALVQRTKATKFALVCGMTNAITSDTEYKVRQEAPGQEVQVIFDIETRKGQAVSLEKMVVFAHSKHQMDEALPLLASKDAKDAAKAGFAKLKQEQHEYLTRFWKQAGIQIEGDTHTQQGLRFNLFHLLQSVGRDGQTNIASKGISGEGYEGHYFWDTETYILPVFLYTMPEIAKSLLKHRYSILDKARAWAKQLSLKGALFAWRTIDGEELSAYFPAGTAQFHINADIIYALKCYYLATKDIDFMLQEGAEMLFETARCWLSLGDHIPGKGFCINCVTGPDEYTAIVNNNTYTNLMVKDHLAFAVDIANLMKTSYPQQYEKLVRTITLDEAEIGNWKRASDEMYVHFDEKRGIYGQDDTFLDKAVWDFKSVGDDKHPFLMHFHYLHIYRYQVIKQADLVLALFLQGDMFSRLDKVRNYDYYEPLTTHDSSLSLCIHSIIAAEIGYADQAYDYFAGSARMDLDDTHHNVRDGVHCAAMAGTWMSLVFGFGGMRQYNGQLSFHPTLPIQWKSYSFNVVFNGRVISVGVSPTGVQYNLIEGDPLQIKHREEKFMLSKNEAVVKSLKPKVEAVIFDLDGVITDTAEFHFLAWKQLADSLEIPFDRSFNENLKGISRLESLDLILSRGPKKVTDDERLTLAKHKNDIYLELLKGMDPSNILPGIRELLTGLRAKGIKVALASASQNAFTVLDKLGITDLFDVIVDARSVKFGKPDPEVFIKAADALGLPYESCVGVEDAAAGVTAIKKAGMTAIGIGDPTVLKKADKVIASSLELTVDMLLQS